MASSAMFDELPYYKDYKLDTDEVDLRSYLLHEDSMEEAIASGRIPTPAVLAMLQRTRGQLPKNPSDKDVPAFPSRRLKTEIFDPGKYAEKDKYVKSLLPEPHESENEFALRLFKQSESNLDKVRAAFYFVCTAALGSMRPAAGESSFYTAVRGIRSDTTHNAVTDIFCQLVGQGGVPCKKILGFKKGLHHVPGKRLQDPNGFYTACYVEGEWRFVDPHWGSSAVINSNQSDFVTINGATGTVESAPKTEGSLVYKCNEFYFLTDPADLVLSHLPPVDMQQWQLLVRPLTLDEFVRAPNFFSRCKQDMKHFSVRLLSHLLDVIVAPPGTIEILLKETGDKTYQYNTVVKISTRDLNEVSRAAIKDQADVLGFLSKYIRMGDGVVKFKFVPPCPGRFLLDIRVAGHQAECSGPADLLSYVIHCPRANERAKKVPRGSEQLAAFGPGPELANAGLSSHTPGEFKAVDGEGTLELTALDGRDHSLDYLVMGAENEQVPSENLLSWKDGGRYNALFLAPGSGSYALVIQECERPVCQFLIEAPSEFNDCGEFGLPDFRKLGGLGIVDRELGQLIRPVSHADPVVVSDESGIDLKFSATEPVVVKAELLSIDRNGKDKPVDGFTFVNSSSEGFDVLVRTQLPGHYVTRLHARRPNSAEWRNFGNYFVRTKGHLDGSASPFPEPGEAWSSDNRLVEPTNRLVPLNKFVPIVLQISDPAIKCVYLVNESTRETTEMNKKNNNTWAGICKGFGKHAGSEITVMGGTDRNSCKPLLKFKFESTSDKAALKEAKQRAEALKEQRKRGVQLRKRRQENYERGERALPRLPENPRAEEEARRLREQEAARKNLKNLLAPAEQQPKPQAQLTKANLAKLCQRGPVSKDVRKTVAAALLLLGHCEAETKSWRRSQDVIAKSKNQFFAVKAEEIQAAIAARSRELLASVSKAGLGNTGAAALYDWADGLASRVHADNIPAAIGEQQLELLAISASQANEWKFQDKNDDNSD